MRLNLIGNGFDLYHGLPCSYYYFGCYLAEHYPDFYVEMSSMFGFGCLRYLGYPEDDTEFVVDNIFWRTFEESLGELDSSWLEESLQDDLKLEYPDDPVELEVPGAANSQVIVEKFTEWIINTVNTNTNFDIIKDMLSGTVLTFNDEDYFINFNYTQTLEKIYDIPFSRILHIHGECDLDVEGAITELIVGHGNKENIEALGRKIDKINESGYYLASQKEKNRLSEFEAELHILRDLRKNVDTLVVDMSRNLKAHDVEPDEIWVWGLSCGDVDKPYIKKLTSLFPNAKWMFSYYDEREKNERKRFVKELGLVKVDYFSFNNSESDNIREEIINQNGIVEFDTV